MLSLEASTNFDWAKDILCGATDTIFDRSRTSGFSERCIETPWVASKVRQFRPNRLLDIGFSLSSLDYLGLLLEVRRQGISVEAVDIVAPQRVQSRYPREWLEDILSVPISIGDVRVITFAESSFDMITCISTIEHVGFDAPSVDNPLSAFDRKTSPENVLMRRGADTTSLVLNRLSDFLVEGGILLISVPMGKGGPTLVQDSLGLFTAQWEYDTESWREIREHPNYELLEEKFFGTDCNASWEEVSGPANLSSQSSYMKPHAAGVALAVLRNQKSLS